MSVQHASLGEEADRHHHHQRELQGGGGEGGSDVRGEPCDGQDRQQIHGLPQVPLLPLRTLHQTGRQVSTQSTSC